MYSLSVKAGFPSTVVTSLLLFFINLALITRLPDLSMDLLLLGMLIYPPGTIYKLLFSITYEGFSSRL